MKLRGSCQGCAAVFVRLLECWYRVHLEVTYAEHTFPVFVIVRYISVLFSERIALSDVDRFPCYQS